MSDGAYGNQAQKKYVYVRNQNKWKTTQNSNVICATCGKKHEGRSCYKEIRVCFGCKKQRHMIWDCLENKKFITEKPNEKNKKDKQKPRAQEQVFAMTHYDTQITFDVVTGTI